MEGKKKDHKPVFRCWSLFSVVPRGASACLTTPWLLLVFWYLLIHSNFGISVGDLQTSERQGEGKKKWSQYVSKTTTTLVYTSHCSRMLRSILIVIISIISLLTFTMTKTLFMSLWCKSNRWLAFQSIHDWYPSAILTLLQLETSAKMEFY